MLSDDEKISNLTAEEREKLAKKAVEALLGKSRRQKSSGRRIGGNRK